MNVSLDEIKFGNHIHRFRYNPVENIYDRFNWVKHTNTNLTINNLRDRLPSLAVSFCLLHDRGCRHPGTRSTHCSIVVGTPQGPPHCYQFLHENIKCITFRLLTFHRLRSRLQRWNPFQRCSPRRSVRWLRRREGEYFGECFFSQNAKPSTDLLRL